MWKRHRAATAFDVSASCSLYYLTAAQVNVFPRPPWWHIGKLRCSVPCNLNLVSIWGWVASLIHWDLIADIIEHSIHRRVSWVVTCAIRGILETTNPLALPRIDSWLLGVPTCNLFYIPTKLMLPPPEILFLSHVLIWHEEKTSWYVAA